MSELTFESSPTVKQKPWTAITRRIVPLLIVLYQLLAILILVQVVTSAVTFFNTPFIGSFVEHTLVINASDSIQPGTWYAKNEGLDYGHRIYSINGETIESVKHLNQLLNRYQVGDVIQLTVITPDLQEKTVPIILQQFPVADQIAQMIIPFVISLIYLGSGLWVLAVRRYDTTGQVFSTFTASVAIIVAGLFEVGTGSQTTVLWTFGLAMAGGTMVHLTFLFPQEVRWIQERPVLGWLSYIPTIVLFV